MEPRQYGQHFVLHILNPLGDPFLGLLVFKNMVPANRPSPESNKMSYKIKQRGELLELFDRNDFLHFSLFYQYYRELINLNQICLKSIFKQYACWVKSFSTFHFLFAISSRVFAVQQFRIMHWKANGQTNLMIFS